MEIQKAKFNGFLSLTDVSLDLVGINFITGENNMGKSSIRDGIEYTITGETRMTKGSKIAEKFLVSDDPNQNKCETAVKIDDSVIKRNRTKNAPSQIEFKVNGTEYPRGPKSHSKRDKQEAVYEHLDLDEDLVHFLLDGRDYIEISPDDRREMLFKVFGINDEDKIKDNLRETNLAESYLEDVKSIIGDYGNIDDLIDHYVELRREAKRKRRPAKKKRDNESPIEVVEIYYQGEEQDVPYKKAIKLKEDKFNDYLVQLDDKIENINFNEDYNGPSAEQIQEKLDDLESKLEVLPERSEVEEEISDLKARKLKLEERYEAAKDGSGTCIYDDTCECPVDEDVVKGFAEDAKETIQDIDEALSTKSSELKKIKRINREFDKYESKLEHAPSEDTLSKLKDLRARRTKLQENIDTIESAQQHNAEYEKAQQQIDSANSSISRANEIIDALEEVKNNIIIEALEDYRDVLSDWSELLDDSFEITDDLELLMKGRPAYALSDSEQLRLAYVNQIALSTVTNAGFFALDDVDTLFGDNRLNLIKGLKAYREKIDTALVIFSSDLEAPLLDGSKLFRISNGVVVDQEG